MHNRFYLQALGVTGLFVGLMILLWVASGGPASEAEVRNANGTRTAVAMTGSFLLQPRSPTPASSTNPTTSAQTSVPVFSLPVGSVPSATNTSLLPPLNSPIASAAASLPPLPSQTTLAQIPIFTVTASLGRDNTKAPPLFPPPGTPGIPLPQSPTAGSLQDPVAFARWYFTRVWNERDYQNLWENYLTISYKANVGSGLYEDYVWWWDSVERVEIHSVETLENTGSEARVRVHLTFFMTDGRVVEDQVYEYDFLYDPSRATWMFDFRP